MLTALHNNFVLLHDTLAQEACGKSLGERSALMAQKWRSLTHQQRESYEKRESEAHEAPLEVFSLLERNNIMLRMTKRQQADVSVTCKMPVF